MIRIGLVALAAALAAGTARAEDSVSVQTPLTAGEVLANGFLLPLALAFSQPHFGFERFPYEDGRGFGRGEREWSGAFRATSQAVGAGRAGGHAALLLRGANRLGWDAAWF
ncbi:MAG: hypothetical protein HY554_00185 [Elusimicrobia bacterium]|nr:hypothetical protein [Elusimicrobiota bacterium]